jgi:hypothetical protein
MQRARLKPTTTKISKKQEVHTFVPQKTPALTLAQHFLHLQRTVGNRAVGRLIQAKLAVSHPGDPYEQEADHMAEQVTSMPSPESVPTAQRQMMPEEEKDTQPLQTKTLAASITPLAQRQAMPEEEKKEGRGIEQQLGQSSGKGSPLPESVRTYMEPRFGTDFSGVRVHTGSESQHLNRSLNAQAFTVGQDMYYGASRSPTDLRLTAHELTHVVQQTGGGTTQRKMARSEPAAVQRDSTVKITKKLSDMSRAEVQQALQEFFQKTMKAQGGKSVRMTEDVKNTIRRILLNDMPGLMKLDSYLGGSSFPGSPAELAAEIAAKLPDPLEASRLAHLRASPGPGPTTLKRIGDLVKKTEPFESPDTLEQKWKFDREATQLRKGEGAVGPFGVDLNRIFNFGKGLPGALKSPPSQTKAVEARSYPQVNAVIDKISKTLLVPAEAKGTSNADNFADAQLVAQALALQLDIAHQQKNDSITLQLGPYYNGVKDRVDMIREVIKLVQLIRDALPHQATGVRTVDIYFGDRLVQRIPRAAKAE